MMAIHDHRLNDTETQQIHRLVYRMVDRPISRRKDDWQGVTAMTVVVSKMQDSTIQVAVKVRRGDEQTLYEL